MHRTVEGLMRRKTSRKSGMTLIEVLLVVAILLVITGMVVPRLVNRQKQANIDATKLSIKGLEQSLKLYALDHGGEYPSSAEGLQALTRLAEGSDKSRWNGPYLEEKPLDAWGRPFHYFAPGQRSSKSFDLSSTGPDGIPDNDDDITNWSAEG